ncbi:hypothetical protein Tco_0905453 [Tanacetum coccineum]
MVPHNNLGPDLYGKYVNETQYRGMIGSLMYLTASRPNIQFSTCVCARYQANTKESHLIAVKRIFRKSTLGACQLLGGKLVCWSAKKQQSVTMSSAKAEYVAAAGCCANILWIKSQLTDYDIIYEKVIFCDNTSAIAISNNPVLHSRTKHIDIRYHFIRYHILKGNIELHFIPTQYQLADIFTKPLDEPTFKRLIVELELTINPTQVFSVHNWILKPNQPGEPPFTDYIKAIYNLDVPKETKSSSAMDTSPSHPSPPILVVDEMHKEAQQAAGGPTSLGATSEEGAHPQLSSGHGASADSTTEADPRISAPSDFVPQQQDGLKTAHTTSGANETSRADDISRKVKLEDLSDILKDTRSAFLTPDSLTDEPIIISDESEEDEEVAKDKDPEDTSVPPSPSLKSAQIQELIAQPSYPDINQLTELLVTSLKPELSKLFASHDFASCLPTELKELPSKITELSGEIKELKKHVRDMEIELPGDLVKIPTKLETFTSTISSLSSQVTETFNRFSTKVDNASGATSLHVFLAGQTTDSPAEGEKNTKYAGTNFRDEFIDLLGKDVLTQYYTKKLLFDKYYDKMLKRQKNPKITNCEVLTKKGPITLNIYREDGSDEVFSNLKVSDLHSEKWREVLQACSYKNEKGWKIIYDLVKTRVDQLTQTEQ